MEIRLCPAPSYKVGKDDGCEKRLYGAFLLLLSNYLLCSAKKKSGIRKFDELLTKSFGSCKIPVVSL